MSEAATQSVNYTDAVCRILKEVGLKFSESKTKDGKKLTLLMPAENAPEIKIYLSVDRDGDLRFRTYLPYGISGEKRPHMLGVVNNLNSRFRFTNLYLDGDGDICACHDALLYSTGESLHKHVMQLLLLFLDIVDECIPDLKSGLKEAADLAAEKDNFTIKTSLFEED